ncbi:MAG TPA: BadF/BadG/BcrA/BcrD ATPase family protein [Candidatus Sulfotelmatobacter sp.]|nr:BadF/BadG/BcrA/BcrD ATPase family protein [Candidatus Sulfotelmatobacter sp.]
MAYFLGIDGGGTKTLCAVGDESQTLATATAGPSNVLRVGEAQARESLHQAVRQACAAAGITLAQVSRTCIGAAGAVRPEIAEIVRRALAELLPSPVQASNTQTSSVQPSNINVVGDMQIALEAAFESGPGVIVIAGTGSIAYGRDAHGNTARAGGWGFTISDEGSAHWIGRAAAAALVRDMDRTEGDAKGRAALRAAPLATALLETWNVTSLEDFARTAGSREPHHFAALFPAVLASPDDSATQILGSAGAELAHLASIVICRLFPPNPSSDGNPTPSEIKSIPVAMAGGVFRHAALVREIFYNQVRWLDPGVQVEQEIVEPVEGALRLARKV